MIDPKQGPVTPGVEKPSDIQKVNEDGSIHLILVDKDGRVILSAEDRATLARIEAKLDELLAQREGDGR